MVQAGNPLGGSDGQSGHPSTRFLQDICAEPEFEHFASLAATICGTPTAAVTLIAGGMQ